MLTTLGIISDTHGYFDTRLPHVLSGVNAILHAGDVGSAAILDELGEIAPVQAVRGNVDSAELGVPPTLLKSFDSVHIFMLHELPRPQSAIREWSLAQPLTGKADSHCRQFLDSLPESCDVVIFGHSHEPCALVLAGKLFLNPGSAGRKRFSLPRCCAKLEVSDQGVSATFLGLESYNDDLPESVYLPIKGEK